MKSGNGKVLGRICIPESLGETICSYWFYLTLTEQQDQFASHGFSRVGLPVANTQGMLSASLQLAAQFVDQQETGGRGRVACSELDRFLYDVHLFLLKLQL